MTSKNLAVLAGTAVVLAGVAMFLNAGNRPAASKLAGKQILPDFDATQVATIKIGDKVKLVAGDRGWTIASLHGYPADREKIVENILKLQELKVGQEARGRKIDAPVTVDLLDAAGKSLATLPLGGTHAKKSTGPYGGGYPDGRYVKFGESVVLVKDTLDAFDGDPKKWCSTRIASISSSDVEAVRYACGKEVVELTKGTNSTWRLKGLGPKEELDTSKTYSLDSGLSYLDFTGIADPKLTDAELGFATGHVYTVTTRGGTNHVAKIGNAAKGSSDRYFRLDGSKWTYTISSYAAENMCKARKDLVKAKEEPKAEKKPEAKKADAKPAKKSAK